MVPSDLLAGARLLTRLPNFLARPIDVERARPELRRRLGRREATFVDFVRRTIYARPASPYAQLLRHAGCQPGDFEELVCTRGVEGALGTLLAAGVYLTTAECRGSRPVRRGSLVFDLDPRGLRNPLVRWDLPMRTGGSRSEGLPVGWNLAFVLDRAVNLCLTESARGPARRRHAIWTAPGSGAIVHLLDICARGSAPARWFSPVDPAAPEVTSRYRVSVRLVRGGARLGGRRLPAPEHVRARAPDPIVDWMASVLREGAIPQLHARPSAVLRTCEAAARRGVDLAGAEALVDGEPITAGRAAAMRRAGLRVLPRYATAEVGLIGEACLEPQGSDDMHVMHDLVAVIQPDATRTSQDLPSDALLISSLRPAAPLILLNVSMGDAGILDGRSCGCPVGAEGWPARLRGILRLAEPAGHGVSPSSADLARVLDETLPARFGGGPGDYQIVEEERPDGSRRLRLLVHPGVGPLDPRAIAAVFVSASGAGLSSDLVAVERRAPMATTFGKVLHTHRTRGELGPPS